MCDHAYFMTSHRGRHQRRLTAPHGASASWLNNGHYSPPATEFSRSTATHTTTRVLVARGLCHLGAPATQLRRARLLGKEQRRAPRPRHAIRTYCTHRTHMNFAHPRIRSEVFVEHFVDFLASFGDRPHWTKLYDTDVETCRSILRHLLCMSGHDRGT